MQRNSKKKFYRVIDANLNRLREGLRVCEDIVRFILDSKALNLEFKKVRHSIKNILKALPSDLRGDLIYFRDSSLDVGRPYFKLEKDRKDIRDLFVANIQRVKESLRVLEEFSKLIDDSLPGRFKRLRYNIYTLEKKTSSKF